MPHIVAVASVVASSSSAYSAVACSTCHVNFWLCPPRLLLHVLQLDTLIHIHTHTHTHEQTVAYRCCICACLLLFAAFMAPHLIRLCAHFSVTCSSFFLILAFHAFYFAFVVCLLCICVAPSRTHTHLSNRAITSIVYTGNSLNFTSIECVCNRMSVGATCITTTAKWLQH